MPEPLNPPYPQQRTPEQHDAVRRRSLPVAICAGFFGIAAIALLLNRTVGVNNPPNILAVNLSCCAVLMGVGIILYAKDTSGTRLAAAASLIAILTGLAGTAIYAKQAAIWRTSSSEHELANVGAIASAAQRYATEHAGVYPADLAILLEQKYIAPETLLSPLLATKPLTDDLAALRAKSTPAELLALVDAHSDYTYVGGDLKLPPPPAPAGTQPTGTTLPSAATLPKEIIVAYAKYTIMGTNLAIAFADGTTSFNSREEVESVLLAANKARASLGLPALAEPDTIRNAIDSTTQP